jgi:CRP/FNR family transcriptional regulator, cyclic AMP receptor protein
MASDMDVRRLQQIFLFRNLPERVLALVAALAQTETFKAGERIFEEGQPGDKFYLILEGNVRISKSIAGLGEEALAILGEGEYFGEMALIDDASRSADAIADRNTTLSVISRQDFVDLLNRNKDLAYELLWGLVRTLSARLRETNAKMTFLAAAGRFA